MEEYKTITVTVTCPKCNTVLKRVFPSRMSRAEERRIEFQLLSQHKQENKECY